MHINNKNRNIGSFKRLHIGGAECQVSIRSQNEIYIFLIRFHLFHVALDIDIFIRKVGMVANQRQQLILSLRLTGQPFLQEKLKFVIPLQIGGLVPFGLLDQGLQDSLSYNILQFSNQRAVLIVFSRNIEGNIFTVYHSFDKPKVVW